MYDNYGELMLGPGLTHRRTTSDHIADALRDAIRNGTLPDGAVLSQVALAERFGTSRVPVREAMRLLQAEGLISAEAHRRAVVRSLSVERVCEIYDIRALMEEYLIEHAVPHIDGAILRDLRTLERRMSRERHHPAWLAMNAQFHHELYLPSGAVTALEMAEQLRTRGERYLNLWSGGRGLNRSHETGPEHQRILAAVEGGNISEAKRQVREHVLHTRDRIVEYYHSRVEPPAAK